MNVNVTALALPLARYVVDRFGDIVEVPIVQSAPGTKILGKTVALGLPFRQVERDATTIALTRVKRRTLKVELRIGVGPLRSEVPLRVLGYAGCVAQALRVELPLIIGDALPSITLFSSAPKSTNFKYDQAVKSLIALAGSLRIAGLNNEISLDLAEAKSEIPRDLAIDLGPQLGDWVIQRDIKHRPGQVGSFDYGLNHASPSMFGDLTDDAEPPFRVTVGGATEAKFWSVRMHVRGAVQQATGIRLAPAAALIIKAIRVPWYQPKPGEPPLTAACTLAAAEIAAQTLANAANPMLGGSGALRREARATRRLIGRQGVAELADATSKDIATALHFAQRLGFEFGPRVRVLMERENVGT